MRPWFWLAAWFMAVAAALPGQPVQMSGSFRPSRTLASAWDSAADGPAGKGHLRIGPIHLGSDFATYVSGHLGYSDISLCWLDPRDGAQRVLAVPTLPGDHWVYYRWSVPKGWRGRSVYLVATDDSNSGWVGVSAPETTTPWGATLELAALEIASFAIILLPGLAWALWKGGKIDDALLACALAAYVAFWAYFISARLGQAYSVALVVLGLIAVGLAIRRPERRIQLAPLLPMLGFALCVCLFYLGVLILYGGAESPFMVPQDRFLPGMPPDTQIPFLLSDLWYRHLPVRPFLGDWLSSDRPPLQAGFHLLVGPWLPRELSAEGIGIIAQSWVFLALWSVLDAVGASRRERCVCLLFTVLSGFILLNATFVWPKLLPAALLLLLFALLYREPGRAPIQAGLLAALAMLSHGGSAFALLAIAIWLLARRLPGGWAFAWRGAVTFVTCLVPWMLYQKLFDPPGDRLLKWHLAGVRMPDPRGLGAVLLSSYRSLSWRAWIEGRWENVCQLVMGGGWNTTSKIWHGTKAMFAGEHAEGWMRAGIEVRVAQMFLFFPALGVLLIGVGPLLWPKCQSPALRWSRALAGVASVTLAIWCLLMFEPGGTVNHQGTYFTNIGWFMALGLALAQYPDFVVWAAALVQAVLFVGAWVFRSPHTVTTPDLLPAIQAPAAMVMTLGACGAMVLLFRGPTRRSSL